MYMRQLLLGITATMLLLTACGTGGGYSILISENGGQSSFKVVRFNDSGSRDSSLDGTMNLTSTSDATTTTVEIAVTDTQEMYGAALELSYDATALTPRSTEFLGLVDTPLELAATNTPGLVSLAQADLKGTARRSGAFARVVFDRKPYSAVRSVSATYNTQVDQAYAPPQLTEGRSGFEITKATAEDADPATLRIYSTFASADGDDNSETNAGDITPMVQQGNFNVAVTDSNFGPAATDYDRNGEVNIADLVPIAQNISRTTSGVEILLGDSDTLTGDDSFAQLAFVDGIPAERKGIPFTSTDWAKVWRTWDVQITLEAMEIADADADGTVFVSARLMDATTPGPIFTGLPLTYDSGPGEITAITLDFPGSDSWPVDGDGNYIVLLTELSVDGTDGNAEEFAPESLGLTATVDTTKETEVDGTTLVLWSLTEGGGLAAVNNSNDRGRLRFVNRGKITVEAHAPGNFALKDELSFVLLSIQELSMELAGGGTGPANVDAGTDVQFVVTGTFDWDGVDNGNEVEQDLTLYCNWAQLADSGNTGTFGLLPAIGAVDTGGASSGDSTQVTCEFPKTDNVTLYDNQKRASNFIEVVIN